MDGESGESVEGMMVRSFTERAPEKRKVKPVEKEFVQLAFGDSESDEDDDDFHADGGNEEDMSDEGPSSDNQESDSDDDDTGDDDDSDDDTGSSGASKDDTQNVKLEDILIAMRTKQKQEELVPVSGAIDGESTVSSLQESTNTNYIVPERKFLVCGICLESEETYADEIIGCDKCGITVHEGCYGEINQEEALIEESGSDVPTEPWFCEPCKAGLSSSPICELCPNIGGIYKMSDSGKWVHLVCALYTPFVGFRDTIKLETPVLEDIKPHMWGGKECSLCEDENFAQTGVCIGCDHGLCKTAFHVTCALQNGLLSDIPAHGEVDPKTAEFLFAHCKLHADKQLIRQHKASLLAYLSNVDNFQLSEEQEEVHRIQVALEKAKKNFRDFRRNVVPPRPPSEPVARLLSSCPEACIKLAKKAEILGISAAPQYDVNSAIIQGSIRKHQPNLSSAFVAYFYKREVLIKDLLASMPKVEPVLQKLQQQQIKLTKVSEDFRGQLARQTSRREALIFEFSQLHEGLCKLADRKFPLPALWKPKRSETVHEKLMESSQLLNAIVHHCFTCKATSDQHLMIQCDTCLQFNHLGCLDPPLTRMPKKSKLYKWQCTDCDSSEDGIENEASDGHDENKKRVPVKPVKFSYDTKSGVAKDDRDAEDVKRKRKRKLLNLRKGFAKKKRSLAHGSSDGSDMFVKTETCDVDIAQSGLIDASTPAKPGIGRRHKKHVHESFDPCDVCKELGNLENIVRCDVCRKCYHFTTCLYPPYKKNPKRRYFQWICEDCDDIDGKPKFKNATLSFKTVSDSLETLPNENVTLDSEPVPCAEMCSQQEVGVKNDGVNEIQVSGAENDTEVAGMNAIVESNCNVASNTSIGQESSPLDENSSFDKLRTENSDACPSKSTSLEDEKMASVVVTDSDLQNNYQEAIVTDATRV